MCTCMGSFPVRTAEQHTATDEVAPTEFGVALHKRVSCGPMKVWAVECYLKRLFGRNNSRSPRNQSIASPLLLIDELPIFKRREDISFDSSMIRDSASYLQQLPSHCALEPSRIVDI